MTQPLTIFIFGIPSVGDIVKSALSGIVETVLKQVLKFVTDALTSIMEAVYSSFLKVDTFGVGGSGADPFDQSGSFVSVATFTNTHVLWLSAAVATISIAVAGGRLLWNYAHGYHEGLKAILSGLAIMVIVNLLVIQAVRVAVWIGDRYTEWILREAHYPTNNDAWAQNLANSGAALLLLLCVGGLVVLSMIVQFIVMIFRSAILVILAGTIVLPASAATTETGRKWLNKYIAWMLAFICMKPAAATIYAVAFRLIEEPGDGGWNKMTAMMAGMVLLGGAVFVMPAMLRLLTPVGVAIGGAMGGGDASSSGGPAQQQADGSSEPASPRGSESSSGSGGGGGSGGLEGGPNGASTAEAGGSGGGGGKTPTPMSGGGGAGSGGTGGGGAVAGTEGASVAAAPETAGASLAVGAAVGAAQKGQEAFQQAVAQGGEEAGGHDGSSGPVGSTGGGVDAE
ncbi:MAG: hypothetical protein J2P24_09050 [Streptosporangiales bacterium]|nr:hypothetical protein [Streptosporangiales bacterium]MBO0889743.1 hypothetical protein [Acidothermales bacterium]